MEKQIYEITFPNSGWELNGCWFDYAELWPDGMKFLKFKNGEKTIVMSYDNDMSVFFPWSKVRVYDGDEKGQCVEVRSCRLNLRLKKLYKMFLKQKSDIVKEQILKTLN